MSYKYLDQCQCQLFVSSTGIFIYTFKKKFDIKLVGRICPEHPSITSLYSNGNR